MHINNALFRKNEIGMPDAHAAQFSRICAGQHCVIISRATGPTCRQLLAQGYDTKGFRVHAKSCDWGPMAGFVLRDPRLSKKGLRGLTYNSIQHDTSLTDTTRSGWKASTVPLELYSERLKWLLTNKNDLGMSDIMMINSRRYAGVASAHGVKLPYSLLYKRVGGEKRWAVCVDTKHGTAFKQQGAEDVGLLQGRYQPLLAMTNPRNHCSWPEGDFRNAITGDYDLFALWPRVSDYEHQGMDKRILGTQQGWSERHNIESNYERHFTQRNQSTKLGNMTNRLYLVGQLLNSAIGGATCADDAGSRTWGPFPKRQVIWHSDEAARPFVNDVDLPVVAFAPSGKEYGITSVSQLKFFISLALRTGFAVNLAEGWTLDPTHDKPDRLGSEYAHLVPSWPGGPSAPRLPNWYNR